MQLIDGQRLTAGQVHLNDGRLIDRQRCKTGEGTGGRVDFCCSAAVHCQLLHQRKPCICASANEVVRPLLCRSRCQHLPVRHSRIGNIFLALMNPVVGRNVFSLLHEIHLSVESLTLSRYAAAAPSSGSPWYSGSRAASTSASPLFSSMALHMLVKTSVQKAGLAADIWYSASAAASLVLAESALRSFTSLSTPPVPAHRGCGEACYTDNLNLCVHCGELS